MEDHDYDTTAENCPYYIDDDESMTAGVSAPTPPPFTVTTEDEHDESDSNPSMPAPAIIADRLRRESRWRPDSDEDDEDGDDTEFLMPLLRRANALDSWENFRERRWRSQRQSQINPIRATRLRTPSRIEPEDHHHHGDDDGGADEGSSAIIQPHARFFIARHKNKITIKFHPAV